MREQDTLSVLTAGLSGACAIAFGVHISMITFPPQWGNFFFFFFERFAPVNLTYLTDGNREEEVPLVCLQHYQRAEPEPWDGGCGVVGWWGYLCTCPHTYTHLGYMAHGAVGCEAKTYECTEPIPAGACVYICVVSVCHCSLCCVCLSVSGCLCSRTEARI